MGQVIPLRGASASALLRRRLESMGAPEHIRAQAYSLTRNEYRNGKSVWRAVTNGENYARLAMRTERMLRDPRPMERLFDELRGMQRDNMSRLKRPAHRRQYSHSLTPGGGPDGPDFPGAA